MILYHGTSSKHLHSILGRGISSRKITGEVGNWEHSVDSKVDYVYLTNCAYALYFAQISCKDDDSAYPIILQVDVPENELYPDEDFVAQVLCRNEKSDKELFETTAEVDLLDYKHEWKKSLDHMGTCAIKYVARDEIVQVVELDGDHPLIYAVDPAISIINYMILGDYYRRVVEWIFDETKEAPQGLFQQPQEYQDRVFTRTGIILRRVKE